MGLKVTPDNLTNILNASGVSTINDNFDLLADEFDKVVYRDGSLSMSGDLDMDSRRILNLPLPVSDLEPIRYRDARYFVKGVPGSPGEGYANRLALADAGLTANDLDDAYLTEGGREGKFIYDSSIPIATHQADVYEGVYIAPNAAANGAWVRVVDTMPRPEWFGAVADYSGDATGGTGTDNAPFIQACVDLLGSAFLKGSYGVASEIELSQNRLLHTSHTGWGNLYTLPTFSGTEVVKLDGTRSHLYRVNIVITDDVFDSASFDPLSPPATIVDGILTEGSVYHQYVDFCRVRGGRRGASLSAFESKMLEFNADGNYDGIYIEPVGGVGGFDQSLINCTTNNSVNYGVYTERGVEATDLHIVRAGETALYINGGTPSMITGLYVDTPSKIGVRVDDVNGVTITGVYFYKMGEGRTFDGGATTGTGTTPDFSCYHFWLNRARNCSFKGANRQTDAGISTDKIFFIQLDTDGSLSDQTRSMWNTWENFNPATVPVIDTTLSNQDVFVARNRFVANSGTLGSYNNEGYVYRDIGRTIAAAGTATVTFFVPDIERNASSSFVYFTFDYSIRSGTADRAAGIGIIPVLNFADTGAAGGVFNAIYTAGTPPTFTITGLTAIKIADGTWKISYTLTNTGAASARFIHSIGMVNDNQFPL